MKQKGNDEKKRENLISSRKMLFSAINANEKLFEEKITLIGAGSVVLSMTYIANLENGIMLCMFYIALALITLALNLNLGLYLLTKNWQKNGVAKMDDCLSTDKDCDTYLIINEINKKASTWNTINLFLMILGIVLMMFFVCINLNNKNMETKDKETAVVYEQSTSTKSITSEVPIPPKQTASPDESQTGSSQNDTSNKK